MLVVEGAVLNNEKMFFVKLDNELKKSYWAYYSKALTEYDSHSPRFRLFMILKIFHTTQILVSLMSNSKAITFLYL